MSVLRNILQRCVRNASILGRSQLCLQHSGNFCPIYSESTCISRKAYSNTVNESAENATHSAQESPFGKTNSMTSQSNNIQKAAKAPLSNKNLNLRKYFVSVCDLSKKISPESLREFYSQFGEITSCDIISHGKPKQRFGSIAFTSEDAKNRALNSLPHCIDGKQIKIIPTTLSDGLDDKEINIINMLSKHQLSLIVLDLSPKTTFESFKAFYSEFGKLNGCLITKNTDIGRFGKVSFAYQKDMNHALDAQPHVIDGSEVFIQYATFDLNLSIGKMPEGVTEETLRAFYSKYGQLRQCRLFVKSKFGTRHAYVSYSTVDEVNRAINDRPHLIDGKPLQVKFAGFHTFCSLFVGSLPENVTEETLREEFSKYGKPVFWEVQNDGRYNQSRAYGIVSYATEEEALKALNSGPHTIEGVVVDVRNANEDIQAS